MCNNLVTTVNVNVPNKPFLLSEQTLYAAQVHPSAGYNFRIMAIPIISIYRNTSEYALRSLSEISMPYFIVFLVMFFLLACFHLSLFFELQSVWVSAYVTQNLFCISKLPLFSVTKFVLYVVLSFLCAYGVAGMLSFFTVPRHFSRAINTGLFFFCFPKFLKLFWFYCFGIIRSILCNCRDLCLFLNMVCKYENTTVVLGHLTENDWLMFIIIIINCLVYWIVPIKLDYGPLVADLATAWSQDRNVLP